MRYAEFDGAEGKQGGPFLNELQVLERERTSAGIEKRDPQYQQVINEHYGEVIVPVAETVEDEEVVFDAPPVAKKKATSK